MARIKFYIYSGKKLVWEMYGDTEDSDSAILAIAKLRAKQCGRTLPRNARVERTVRHG